LTPLQEQPEPPNIVALTAALVQRWPMTNLLDILKETELRVGFTEAFRTVGAREMLKPEILQRRLLLCLYGLGTNAGLKRMCSGGGDILSPVYRWMSRGLSGRYFQRSCFRLPE
jgi:hypothetical protein